MAKEQASDIHSALEEQVQGDQNLKRTAAKAFIAYVRAYATYPSSLKHIFHVKSLQLGHVAKSFALKVGNYLRIFFSLTLFLNDTKFILCI